MEYYKSDKNPVHPFRELSFTEFDCKEYCDECKNMSNVSTKPMSPIEQRPTFASWMRSEEGTNWLKETDQGCDCSYNGMRIIDLKQ